MKLHGVVTVTLCSADFGRTERFYHGLFGWEMHRTSETYLGFDPPAGRLAGGFLKRDVVDAGDSCTIYVQVSDFQPYGERVAELGGCTDGHVEGVPGYGSYVVVRDPDGHRIGLWRPSQ